MTLADVSANTVIVQDKIKAVPMKFWLVVGGGALAIVLIVTFLRKIAHMNKIWVSIVMALIFALVGFNWVYKRNEPKFLTPLVDKIAPWFPSAASAAVLPADSKK